MMDTVRIQFDIPADLWERMSEYVLHYKDRNTWAHEALIERINRMEARDERARSERIAKDRKVIREEIQRMKERGEI